MGKAVDDHDPDCPFRSAAARHEERVKFLNGRLQSFDLRQMQAWEGGARFGRADALSRFADQVQASVDRSVASGTYAPLQISTLRAVVKAAKLSAARVAAEIEEGSPHVDAQ